MVLSDSDKFKNFKDDVFKIIDKCFVDFSECCNSYVEKFREVFLVVKLVVFVYIGNLVFKEFGVVFMFFLDILGRVFSKSFLFLLRVDFKEFLG